MDRQAKIERAVREHAAREYPREACGVVVNAAGGPRYLPIANIASSAAHFSADPRDLLVAEEAGEIIAVVHSHPDGMPDPSEPDRAMLERWGIPWLIVSWPAGEIRQHLPRGRRPPLLGRVFEHGVLDCYSLVRDYYQQVLAVTLPDFAREDAWWLKGGNLYINHFREAGFREVDPADIREHDGVLMALRSQVPNHAGIYLGNDALLHHATGRLSRRETYSGFWQSITRKIVRHESQ